MKHFICVSRFSKIFLSFTFWPLSLVWACLSTIRSLAALTVPSFRQKWCLLSAVTCKEYTYHLPKIFLSTTKNILVTCQEYTYLSPAKNKLVTCHEYSCHLQRILLPPAKKTLFSCQEYSFIVVTCRHNEKLDVRFWTGYFYNMLQTRHEFIF